MHRKAVAATLEAEALAGGPAASGGCRNMDQHDEDRRDDDGSPRSGPSRSVQRRITELFGRQGEPRSRPTQSEGQQQGSSVEGGGPRRGGGGQRRRVGKGLRAVSGRRREGRGGGGSTAHAPMVARARITAAQSPLDVCSVFALVPFLSHISLPPHGTVAQPPLNRSPRVAVRPGGGGRRSQSHPARAAKLSVARRPSGSCAVSRRRRAAVTRVVVLERRVGGGRTETWADGRHQRRGQYRGEPPGRTIRGQTN